MLRKGIDFVVNAQGTGIFSGKGRMILTTCRIVLVNEMQEEGKFQAFDLPFATTYDEKFKKPFFGKSFLEGKFRVRPNPQRPTSH